MPKNLCRKSYRPEGAYMMNGAMPMEMIAMITPLIRPTRTSPLSLSFFLKMLSWNSREYNVTQEFSVPA